jgi:archaeosine synthase
VESRLSEPWLVSLLRHMDLRQGALCERFSPVNRPETAGPILALAKASLDRPEVVRFRERVVHRYKRPPGAPVLLLLPCSARKPYSSSLSHRMFRSRIDRCRNPGAVHEVVVTSPLGVVPLELENFYPAGNYDVPVTGDWDAEEMRVLREELKAFVTAGKYHRVVCHLPGMEFLKAVLPEHTAFTVTGSATSHDSLDRLEEALRTAVHEVPKKGRREALFERLQALCRFQFGEGGPALLEGCDIKFRGPDIKFMGAGNFQAGMVLHDRGLVSLTMDGGKRLLGKTGYEVEIGDFMPSSAVFAAGVLHAGPVIRPGDEVLVVHKGELRGVGVAVMSACEMEERGKGTAVKVRHHISSGKEKGNEGKEATEE